MSQFIQTLSAVAQSANLNHAGAPAYKHGLRDQVRNFLRCGTLSGTFYVSAQQDAVETIETLRRFGEQDAVALAEEAISAREEGFMRTLPILAVVVLSGLPNKELFRETAKRVLKVPRDVAQFVLICKTGAVPGAEKFAGCRIGSVKTFLESLSEYHGIKGTQMEKMPLRDLVRMAHPKPSSDQKRELFGWLSGHVESKSVSVNASVMALQKLKGTTDVAEQVQLIREGRLPYEAVSAVVTSPDVEVWRALLEQAPTFNLMRNLATFHRHGVFANSQSVELAVSKLTREGAMRQAKILPFRAYQAWKAYSALEGHDLRIVAALSDALTNSVANMPLFTGRVCIAPDVSGSMHCPIKPNVPGKMYRSSSDELSCMEVAGIFAAGLLARSANAVVLPFSNDVIDVRLNPRDSVLANAQTISSIGGGGTAMAAPVDRLLEQRDVVDLYVAITDSEDWIGRFEDSWRRYKAEVAPAAKAVLVTVVPDPYRVVPESTSDVHYVHGWSDAVLRYVSEIGGGAFESSPVDEE